LVSITLVNSFGFACALISLFSGWAQSSLLAQSNTPSATWAATGTVGTTNEITFGEFLNEVAAANLTYAAQRYNVSIAEAGVAAAKEFQNPTLQLSGDRDVTYSGSERMPSTFGAGLTQPVELGGKRKYRILGARQSYAAAAATLDDFLRNFKLDAAAAFADALALSRNAEQKRESAEFLRSLVETQRERHRAGAISQADMLQTQVEEQQFQNELLATQAEAQNALLALSAFLGRDRGRSLLIPKGNLEIPTRDFDLSGLLADGLQRRADLIALRHARDAAQSRIRLEKASRFPNVDVGAGWTRSTKSDNSIAPAPEFDAVGVTFSFPLPLWNRNQAAIAAARFAAAQVRKQLEAAELKAEVQIASSGIFRGIFIGLDKGLAHPGERKCLS
jgi:outer membrane protein, heavy metal efflux system